jgi:hypothetical protein
VCIDLGISFTFLEKSVGGYFSVPARTQIWWDLIPTDIDGDPQSGGLGLVDPRDLGDGVADDRWAISECSRTCMCH